MPKTMFQKLWDAHVVAEPPGQSPIIYIDLHLLHEVTSPQAFGGLELAGRRVRRPDLSVATIDHNVSTTANRATEAEDAESQKQIDALRQNTQRHGIKLYDISHRGQGIVHMLGPEQGYTQPGMTIVCGDSHTSTHGAFGTFAFGIGTSEVEHVLATQTVRARQPRTLNIRYEGELPSGITAKDMILSTIRTIGVNGGRGRVVEYSGQAIKSLDMEGRMTICNMSIEAGARAGMIQPDDTTYRWLEGRPKSPRGSAWERALARWQQLPTDDGAAFDDTVEIDCSRIEPYISWGTNPAQSIGVSERVPEPRDTTDPDGAERALAYMDLQPGISLTDVAIDRVFIGSCTNARLADLRRAARVVDGRRVSRGVRAMVVPGSTLTKYTAEQEGLDQVFKSAGFEWREAGCSMCLGMNPDILSPGERCASTSNRNFEGRQGAGGRTHLVSPEMAAAAAVAGRFVDIREWS